MDRKKTNGDYQTDWAFVENFKDYIHISNAESGRNGYYCLGCKKELQAVKGQIREHYFRHDAKDVNKNSNECVVANKNYRERIARDILQRLKQLKLPAVYKYPPKKGGGPPYLIQASQVLRATTVKSELSFYEDDDCNIQYGQNPNIDERHLLVRPDITFFNEKEKPILLVEFVITHKIDNEKKSKLKRLGINTVQIIIPKKSEGDIEKALKSSSKVKWVYNEIESTTKYFHTSESLNDGVREIDDEQRRIFEESYNCRTIQIKNLIRSVSRSMESQSYKRAEQYFNREISRVEKATEAERSGLEQMENRFSAEVYSQFAGEFEQLAIEKNKLRRKEKGFQEYCGDLEGRYQQKIRDIRGEAGVLEKTTKEVSRESESEEAIRRRFENEEVWEQSRFESARDRLQRDIKEEEESYRRISDESNPVEAEFEQATEREQKDFENKRRSIRLRKENIESIVNDTLERDIKHNSQELPKGIKTLLEKRRFGDDFKNLQRQEKRYQGARKFFNSGTWKTR